MGLLTHGLEPLNAGQATTSTSGDRSRANIGLTAKARRRSRRRRVPGPQAGQDHRTGEVEVRALRDVDLEVARGEFIVLLGPSGSGKSTLLNILGGLDVPSTGQVIFEGQDLSAASEAELIAYRRRHVGFVSSSTT